MKTYVAESDVKKKSIIGQNMLKLQENEKRGNSSSTELALSSDNVTINHICDIENLKATKSTSLNFRKAVWLKFRQQTELFRKAKFSGIFSKVDNCYRGISNKAASRNIVQGRIPELTPLFVEGF